MISGKIVTRFYRRIWEKTDYFFDLESFHNGSTDPEIISKLNHIHVKAIADSTLNSNSIGLFMDYMLAAPSRQSSVLKQICGDISIDEAWVSLIAFHYMMHAYKTIMCGVEAPGLRNDLALGDLIETQVAYANCIHTPETMYMPKEVVPYIPNYDQYKDNIEIVSYY